MCCCSPRVELVSRTRHAVGTPIGWLDCCAVDGAVTEIDFLGHDAPTVGGRTAPTGVLAELEVQLGEYFDGTRREFDVPLAPAGTAFQHEAWTVLRSIPYAATITYAEQARRLGRPRAVRAVGGANARNPLPIVVPCHRVVGASGQLVGFAGGLDRKAWLLDHERRHGSA